MGDEPYSRSFLARDPYSELEEAHMWETIKNALIGAKDAVGIEIPGLPSDLGASGDSAATTRAGCHRLGDRRPGGPHRVNRGQPSSVGRQELDD